MTWANRAAVTPLAYWKSEIPSHTHALRVATDDGDLKAPTSSRVLARSTNGFLYQTSTSGLQPLSDQALAPVGRLCSPNNLQPYLTFYFCIALQAGSTPHLISLPGNYHEKKGIYRGGSPEYRVRLVAPIFAAAPSSQKQTARLLPLDTGISFDTLNAYVGQSFSVYGSTGVGFVVKLTLTSLDNRRLNSQTDQFSARFRAPPAVHWNRRLLV